MRYNDFALKKCSNAVFRRDWLLNAWFWLNFILLINPLAAKAYSKVQKECSFR